MKINHDVNLLYVRLCCLNESRMSSFLGELTDGMNKTILNQSVI